MPITANSLIDDLATLVTGEGSTPAPLPISDLTLDNTSSHDFLSFEYLLDPADSLVVEASGLSAQALGYLSALKDDGISPELLELTIEFLAELEAILKRAIFNGLLYHSKHTADSHVVESRAGLAFRSVTHRLYGPERHLIPEMLDIYVSAPSFLLLLVYSDFSLAAKDILNALFGIIRVHVPGTVSQIATSPSPAPPPQPTPPPQPQPWPTFTWSWADYFERWKANDSAPGTGSAELLQYPFEVFPFPSTNIGIAITYRQRWRLLGIQPGEIVKTIPLGPGQIEKVSTKVTRRTKQTRSMESSTETESSTESSDTIKDSTEVVNEAAQSQKWSRDAEASYSGFGFGAKVSTHLERNRSSSSKQTTSNLSESMRKTAQKMKRQSKVTVTTETEVGFDTETASEIRNANDEVAVTYYYHTLQRQYEVHTYLAAVANCVFVAEAMPRPYEINGDWVRQHDYVIARVLKDESFRDALNELIRDADDPETNQQEYVKMLNKAREDFATFSLEGSGAGAGSGVSLPDIYAEPQRLHDQSIRDAASRARENALRQLRRARLYNHIRQNILHYCRAIWLAEDNDQRMLRYSKENRTVPLLWTADVVRGQTTAPSDFEPVPGNVSILDVIDTSGPIGATGNYLVYSMRRRASVDLDEDVDVDTSTGTLTLPLQDVLDLLRAPFSRGGKLVDPARDAFEADADAVIAETPELLSTLDDDHLRSIVSHLPTLRSGRVDANGIILRDAEGRLLKPLTRDDYVDYLMKRDATRRFLVDSNNLYLSLHIGSGVALEPFKRAHRYLDVLKASEETRGEALKNERRENLRTDAHAFDPDISKVVVVSGNAKPEDMLGGALDGGDPPSDV